MCVQMPGDVSSSIGVGKLEATELHTDVNLINWSVELGQHWLKTNFVLVKGLKVPAIVGRKNQ